MTRTHSTMFTQVITVHIQLLYTESDCKNVLEQMIYARFKSSCNVRRAHLQIEYSEGIVAHLNFENKIYTVSYT